MSDKELDAVAGGASWDQIVEEDGYGWAILCLVIMGVGVEW